MKVFIIDNHDSFVKDLEQALLQYNPDIKILGKLDSANKSLRWFQANESPDLVFMDIDMAEELDFDTFEKLLITAPIIYVTEFKDYIIRVFQTNEVDFLLKPLDKDDLYALLRRHESTIKSSLLNMKTDVIDNVMKILNKEYKKRFMIKEEGCVNYLSVNEISSFYQKDKKLYLYTLDKKEHLIDYTIDLLEKLVDPKIFFRVNAKYLINITAIIDNTLNDEGVYEITTRQSIPHKILVDKEKTNDFMVWYKDVGKGKPR